MATVFDMCKLSCHATTMLGVHADAIWAKVDLCTTIEHLKVGHGCLPSIQIPTEYVDQVMNWQDRGLVCKGGAKG